MVKFAAIIYFGNKYWRFQNLFIYVHSRILKLVTRLDAGLRLTLRSLPAFVVWSFDREHNIFKFYVAYIGEILIFTHPSALLLLRELIYRSFSDSLSSLG
jgi:hypothetical protein